MRYSKIALINPPLDDGKTYCVDNGYWAPLNLLCLASYLHAETRNLETRILDHQVIEEKSMWRELADFQPDLVGLSPTIDSYQKTLRIAANVKRKWGADVVLGGSYATEVAENILNLRPFIDYVIVRDGEIALTDLAAGVPIKDVDNLVYREQNVVKRNNVRLHATATLREIDYSHIDLNPYFENHARSLNPGSFSKPVAFMTQRGCAWREKSGGCVFCSRIEPFARFDNPEESWANLRNLRERFGVDSMLEVSDDFLGDLNWFHHFHESRPSDMKQFGIRFIYGRANHINPENADILADLNTEEICLGVESGDERILRNTVKGCSPARQRHAMKLLEERDIKMIVSILLGLPGETAESLKNTRDFVEETLAMSNVNEMVVSIMIPLPGSRAHSQLLNLNPGMRAKYSHWDEVRVNEMQRDWVENFCEVDYATLVENVNAINAQCPNAYVEMFQ